MMVASLFPSANLALVLAQDAQITPTKEATINDADSDGDDLSTDLKSAIDERRKAYEAAKAFRKTTLDRAKTLKEEAKETFKKRLQELKDQRKAKILENLAERIAKKDEKWVDHFNKILSRLSQLLAKIKIRAEELAADGVDVTEVNVQIAEADAAILAAQEAVNALALNVYPIDTSDERALKQSAKGTLDEFKTDVKEVRALVKIAKDEVRDAWVALMQAAGEESEDQESKKTNE